MFVWLQRASCCTPEWFKGSLKMALNGWNSCETLQSELAFQIALGGSVAVFCAAAVAGVHTGAADTPIVGLCEVLRQFRFTGFLSQGGYLGFKYDICLCGSSRSVWSVRGSTFFRLQGPSWYFMTQKKRCLLKASNAAYLCDKNIHKGNTPVVFIMSLLGSSNIYVLSKSLHPSHVRPSGEAAPAMCDLGWRDLGGALEMSVAEVCDMNEGLSLKVPSQ